MKPSLIWERLLAGAAIMLILATIFTGLIAWRHDRDIDLDASSMLVFEASMQLRIFERVRFAANQVLLGDPAMRPDALKYSLAIATSRMRNLRDGTVGDVGDLAIQKRIVQTISLHDKMLEAMSRADCDARCRAGTLMRLATRIKREFGMIQSSARTTDSRMRATLHSAYEKTVHKLFLFSMFLIGACVAVTLYMARKNALLKQQAMRLEESQRQIAEVSEYRARFLAGMSHEFRTPLNAIKGFSQFMLMMKGQVKTEKLLDYLSSIEKSAVDLENLTDTVLDLAKVDAGAIDLNESTFDFVSLLSEVKTQFSAGNALDAKRLQFHMPPSLMVTGDESALKRCVQNLISNALKFSRYGTSVEVRLWQEPGGDLGLSVADQGCGIPKEELEAVWGVYARSSYTRVSDKQGTGLGLPIVRALVSAHGGKTRLSSVLDEGTTATLHLPAFRAVDADALSVAA